MARTTIYVPDYLFDRCKAELPHLNLSEAVQVLLGGLLDGEGKKAHARLCAMCRRATGLVPVCIRCQGSVESLDLESLD